MGNPTGAFLRSKALAHAGLAPEFRAGAEALMKAQGHLAMQFKIGFFQKAAGRLLMTAAVAFLVAALAGCAGPRMKRLAGEPLPRLDPDEKVGVYIGTVDAPYQAVALIDSDAFGIIDDEVKSRQLDQLRERARRLGANAVQEVRILPKKVRGFSLDERTPFESWKQGEYELYFMRGMAIHLDEEEPANLSEIEPDGGWIADSLPVPPRLAMPLDEPLAAPALRTQ